jgi:hypothetical protein
MYLNFHDLKVGIRPEGYDYHGDSDGKEVLYEGTLVIGAGSNGSANAHRDSSSLLLVPWSLPEAILLQDSLSG